MLRRKFVPAKKNEPITSSLLLAQYDLSPAKVVENFPPTYQRFILG